MEISELCRCSFTGRPGSCSRFPGVAKMADGNLVVLYDDGVDCDSIQHEIRVAISADRGRSWQDVGVMYDPAELKLGHRFTENCKPTRIDRDELVAVGFGFIRDEPELGLAAYATKYGRFPESRNTFSRSCDGGRSWLLPGFISSRFDTALELSGPALWCEPEKELLVFGAPFVLHGQEQQGICLGSRDRGATWEEYGCFFASATVAPWEVRALREASGRIWLVLWNYDLALRRHLNNRLVYSDDLGRSWSAPIDSGVMGQAANLFVFQGDKYLLYTVREGGNTGIYCASFTLGCDGTVKTGTPLLLWDASGMALAADDPIEKQFRALAFGQPSMTDLGRGEWLLLYWSCEQSEYAIRARVLLLK